MFEAHFQTFEEPEGGVALTARLAAFREELARRKLTGFVIPRADQQQNEYVAPSEERLAWLTGFTGSAGIAVVLTKAAAIFVDGRYTLQAAKQVDGKAWSVEPLVDAPPESWLEQHLVAGDRLGFDPWLHTSVAAERLAAACAKAGAELVAVESYPLVPKNGRPTLFIDHRKLSNSARDHLEQNADVREPDALTPQLTDLAQHGASIALDNATAADALKRLIAGAGGKAITGSDPVA